MINYIYVFSLQQLLIFNIDSICTKSESANNKSILIKELLTQSLICQVRKFVSSAATL